jgi:lactate dehydrogenase-like 2-hydroxyacid dehydrogenase
MAKPRVLVTRRWPEEVERVLVARFDTKLNESDSPLAETDFSSAMRDFDAVLPTVSDKLPPGLFAQPGIRTKILGNFGVGFNHIDIAGVKAAGIVVTNTPGVLTDATADISLTLMLMIARRAGEGERQLRAGEWQGWCPTHMLGRELSGKTLGIIGMGRIGKATARRAHFGFGMEIVFFNRSTVDDDETRAMKARQLGSIDELMAASDFVSLHCPGGAENRHLIDARRLKLMKPEAFLINTARGDVVDSAALAEALRTGSIAGAGLDVYEGEPAIPAGLADLENVVLLPHLGSATSETRTAMGMKVVENITVFFEGRDPPDRIA